MFYISNFIISYQYIYIYVIFLCIISYLTLYSYVDITTKTYVFDRHLWMLGIEDQFLLHVVTSIFHGVIAFWKFSTHVTFMQESRSVFFTRNVTGTLKKTGVKTRVLWNMIRQCWETYAVRLFERLRIDIIVSISAQENRRDLCFLRFNIVDWFERYYRLITKIKLISIFIEALSSSLKVEVAICFKLQYLNSEKS